MYCKEVKLCKGRTMKECVVYTANLSWMLPTELNLGFTAQLYYNLIGRGFKISTTEEAFKNLIWKPLLVKNIYLYLYYAFKYVEI